VTGCLPSLPGARRSYPRPIGGRNTLRSRTTGPGSRSPARGPSPAPPPLALDDALEGPSARPRAESLRRRTAGPLERRIAARPITGPWTFFAGWWPTRGRRWACPLVPVAAERGDRVDDGSARTDTHGPRPSGGSAAGPSSDATERPPAGSRRCSTAPGARSAGTTARSLSADTAAHAAVPVGEALASDGNLVDR